MNPAVIDEALAAAAVAPVAPPEAPLSAIDRIKAAMSAPALSAVPEIEVAVAPLAETPVSVEDEFELPPLDGIMEHPIPAIEEAPPPPTGIPEKDELEREFGKFLALPRGKMFHGAYATMRDLSKLPEEGGIGFKPTAADIKAFHDAEQDWRAVQRDFSAPEPEAKGRFLDFWLGQDNQGRSRPGTEELVEMIPVYLNERNPQAFQRLSRPMYEGLAQRFMELSKVSADPAEKDLLAKAADLISRDQLGRPLVQPSQPQPGSQLPPDVERELSELRRFRASQQQQQQTSAQQQQTAYATQIDDRCNAQILADVEYALAPATGIKEANPFVYNATKNQMIADLKSHLARNSSGMSRVEFAKNRAVSTRDPQQVVNVVNEQRRLYTEPLRRLKLDALKALGVITTAQAAATADQRNLSAGKTAPAASSATPAQPVSPGNPKQLPGESNRNRLTRLMSAGG